MTEENEDGCELDFTKDVTPAEELEALLVPKGDEEPEDDD